MSTYKKLPAYIQDQLLPFEDMNTIKNNVSKVASIFGITEDEWGNDYVPCIKLGGASPSGGKICFGGNASKYIEFDNSTNDLVINGIDLNLTGEQGVIRGDRMIFCYDSFFSLTNFAFSNDYKYLMTNSQTSFGEVFGTGSILAVNIGLYVNTVTGTDVTLTPEILKDGSSLATISSFASMASNTMYSTQDVFDRDDHSWVFGNKIDLKLTAYGTVGFWAISGNIRIYLETILDGVQ